MFVLTNSEGLYLDGAGMWGQLEAAAVLSPLSAIRVMRAHPEAAAVRVAATAPTAAPALIGARRAPRGQHFVLVAGGRYFPARYAAGREVVPAHSLDHAHRFDSLLLATSFATFWSRFLPAAVPIEIALVADGEKCV